MCLWPKFTPNKDLVPHPQKLLKLKNFVFFVFYTHSRLQNSISQLLTINSSKVMLETIIFQFLEVPFFRRNCKKPSSPDTIDVHGRGSIPLRV